MAQIQSSVKAPSDLGTGDEECFSAWAVYRVACDYWQMITGGEYPLHSPGKIRLGFIDS